MDRLDMPLGPDTAPVRDIWFDRRTVGEGWNLEARTDTARWEYSLGAATWKHSLVAAAKGGRIVTPGATSGPNPEEEIRHIFWKQLSILGSTMGTDAEFVALLAAVSAGRIVPVVDSVIPLAEGRKAYERMQSSQGLGKIVVKVSG